MRKKTFFMALVLAVLLGLTAVVQGQTEKEALEALKKLQSKTETGLSFKDYSNALGDANYEVKKYLEGQNSKKNDLLRKSISKAWFHYTYAQGLWKLKITRSSAGFGSKSDFINRNDGKVYNYLITEYPYMRQAMIGDSIAIDLAIPIIWGKASEEIQYANKLIGISQK